MGEAKHSTSIADRDLIERHVERVVVKPQALEVRLVPTSEASALAEEPGSQRSRRQPAVDAHDHAGMDRRKLRCREGHCSYALRNTGDEAREPRRSAYRHRQGPDVDRRHQARPYCLLAEIAKREGQVERHIRLLAPLAFVSPRIIAAIFDGTAPADLTVTGLAKALPYSWAEQEQSIGLLQ